MKISVLNPPQMCTVKCLKEKMVNRMLGEPGDSQSPQKRSVLPFETDWDGARRRRPRRLETKGTIQRDDHGGRLPLSGGASAVHEDTITCGEMPFFPFPHTPVPFE